MRRQARKILGYGALLAAGAALGMQLVSGTSSTGGADLQTSFTAGTLPDKAVPSAVSEPVKTSGTAISEQGSYITLSNGKTYYYVQDRPRAAEENPAGIGQNSELAGEGEDQDPNYLTPGQLLLSPAPETTVDRFAGKTGELLQKTSQKGINWIVSLFGSLTD